MEIGKQKFQKIKQASGSDNVLTTILTVLPTAWMDGWVGGRADVRIDR